MSHSGYVQCFLFDQAPVRGCIARLNPVWLDIRAKRSDPPEVERLLGEMLAACALLSAHLKFEGNLSLQLMGNGPLSLLVAEFRSTEGLRATARYQQPVPDGAGFINLVGPDARFAVVIDQGKGQPWQGVVPVNPEGIAASLQDYFEQSEQLATRFKLVADQENCAGFLLQKMPDTDQKQEISTELFMLADTLKDEELLQWNEMELLHRLFSEHDIRLFDASPRKHVCTCSREGVANMIRALGRQEVEQVLEEKGELRVRCEFCGSEQVFDAVDVAELFVEGAHEAPSEQQ